MVQVVTPAQFRSAVHGLQLPPAKEWNPAAQVAALQSAAPSPVQAVQLPARTDATAEKSTAEQAAQPLPRHSHPLDTQSVYPPTLTMLSLVGRPLAASK